VPLGPTRLLDTRADGVALTAHDVRIVDTTVLGIPRTAAAAAIELTGIAADAWFAAWPDIRKAELAAIAWPSLPPQLLSRPKTGFSVPVRDWIRPEGSGPQERGLRGWAKFVYGQFAP